MGHYRNQSSRITEFLQLIREGKPLDMNEVLQLWYRVQNYEALETIVDIAVREQMPIWAAEESFKESWAGVTGRRCGSGFMSYFFRKWMEVSVS